MTERVALCAVALLLSTSGCRPPTADPDPLPASDACIVVDDTARARITIGIAGAVTPPSMPQRGDLAGAQLFDTLVRLDCTGSVIPGLADAWSTDDSVTWRFTIARDATFSDGAAVTASSVVESWAARQVQFASVTAIGSELRAVLRSAAGAALFARPDLAITRPADGRPGAGGWPAGTGAYRLDTIGASMLRLLARRPGPAAPDTIDVRYFRGDPRNALDAGVDVIVTGDAAALSYAHARPGYRTTPLPWKSTYVLATHSTRGTAGGAGSGERSDVEPPGADDLAGLARDAAPGVSRRAMSPFWWQECVLPAPAPGRSSTDGLILYEQGDDVARRLAERVTALAWPRADAPAWLRAALGTYSAPPVSQAVSRADLVDAVRTRAGLVVASLPRSPHDGCAAITADSHIEALLSFPGRHITPLVDTREHLIHRSGVGRVRVDADGTIRFGAR